MPGTAGSDERRRRVLSVHVLVSSDGRPTAGARVFTCASHAISDDDGAADVEVVLGVPCPVEVRHHQDGALFGARQDLGQLEPDESLTIELTLRPAQPKEGFSDERMMAILAHEISESDRLITDLEALLANATDQERPAIQRSLKAAREQLLAWKKSRDEISN